MPGWLVKATGLAVGLTMTLAAAACSAPASTQDPTAAESSPAGSTTSAPLPPVPAGLATVTVAVPDGLDAAPLDTARQAQVPAGWTISVWARVPKARLAAWTPDGALLVSVPSRGEVVKLVATEGGSPETTVLLDGLDQPHGLVLRGDTLYLAQSDQIDSYTYRDGRADQQTVVAADLPDAKSPDLRGAYSHALKSVAVGSDGALYFSIGSTGNISAADRDATPPRATIMRVPPGGGPAEPFATGVRNGTGLAAAPDGAVWTAVNNRDNVRYPGEGPDYGQVLPDYVTDHPPESVARLTPGRELGWPFCNPDGGPADLVLIPDVETNPDSSRMDCAALPPIEQSLGAHSAPLGMAFGELPAPFGVGALVGVHGSWNAKPPRAPEVSFFPWSDGELGDQQTLVGGFQAADGTRWGRPVAAVTGPDGAVYITDDYAGAVYRLAPPGR
jgi:glucose/arabinose dehydrogenase